MQDKQHHAVSAYTQVKMEDAPRLLEIPKSECPDTWLRLPRHTCPTSWSNIEDLVLPLERKLYGRPLAESLCERQFEKSSIGSSMGKSTELGIPIRASKARSIPIGVRGSCNSGWKKATLQRHVEEIDATG